MKVKIPILLRLKIIYASWKLGLKYSDLRGIWLALDLMLNKTI